MFVTRTQYNLIHAQRAYTKSGDGQTEGEKEKARKKRVPATKMGFKFGVQCLFVTI